MKRMQRSRIVGLIFGLSMLVGLSAVTIDRLERSPFSKVSYLTDREAEFIRPGLKVSVTKVEVAADKTVSVTFNVTDGMGQPLDMAGVLSPGVIAASYILAYIPSDGTQYVSLSTRAATSPITGVTTTQAGTDSGGTLTKISDGTYRFALRTKLPANDDANATHSIGMYVTRDLRPYGLAREVVNEVVHFTPSGAAVKKVRDVVRTEACNQCHDPLAMHGGSRQKVELCVLCHTPQTTDPDTGNTVNLAVMVHKIHRGHDLPSVRAGQPYQIIGNSQSMHDFSTVAFPRDVRNCETCHQQTATQKDAYLLRPSRAACGSCHDDVNFTTGEKHPGGPQVSDRLCSTCHIPEGETEFDASIKGAHTQPNKSRQLAGVNLKILEVVNTQPGQNPTVRYTLKNNAGQPVLPSDMNSFSLVMAGPTTDYTTRISEDPRAGSVQLSDGSYAYMFKAPISQAAKGTYAFGGHGYRTIKLNPGTTKELDARDSIPDHSVTYAAVTDKTPAKRRTVVARQNCNTCHDDLGLHGGTRHDPEYCVMCHQAGITGRHPDGQPGNSIHFKFMIHRIHTGEELEREFNIAGTDFKEVRFPGDRRNCAKCHAGNSYEVPSKGVMATVAPREFYSPIPPNSAACLGCHDSLDAAAHTYAMTTPFGESCAACHGPNAEFAVAKVHAR